VPSDAPAPARPGAARATSTGWGRLLIAVYAVFAVAATGRSSIQLATQADEAPFPYALSALAAVLYLVATWALASDRPGHRRVAWAAVTVEAAGVVVVGTLSLVDEALFPDDTVWSAFGAGYAFFPALLPVAGIAWLLATRPRG